MSESNKREWLSNWRNIAQLVIAVGVIANAVVLVWLKEKFPSRVEFEDLRRSVAGRVTKQELAEYIRNHDEMRRELVDNLRRDSVIANEHVAREIQRVNERLQSIEQFIRRQ